MRRPLASFMPPLTWLGFFGLILLAWGGIYRMQPGGAAANLSQICSEGVLAGFCAATTAQSQYLPVLSMWVLMTAAMMAPTFVPTLRTYRDLGDTGAADRYGFFALLAGYLSVWLGFSLLAASAQLVLARAGIVSQTGASLNWGLTAALLATAGAYQFTTLRAACVAKCRAPLSFFIAHWQPGPAGALRMGLRLGALCLGCCWALMALGFIGGVMNLIWMGLATLLMTLEKLPEIGRWLSRPLGAVLLAAAGFSALKAVGI
jgi:predicted metal-binding membrane protein